MTKTAWAHLPNAAHVDRILASLAAHPEKWEAARGGAWSAVYIGLYTAANTAANIKAWDAAWNAAWDASRYASRGAAFIAIAALVAWDDCAYMLELPEDALKLLRAVGNEQALLLFGAAKVLKETSC